MIAEHGACCQTTEVWPPTVLVGSLPTASIQVGGALEKNRQLVAELTRRGLAVQVCNTNGWRRHPISMAVQVRRSVRSADQIIMSLSKPGLTVVAVTPLSYMLRSKHVCLMAVGGGLDAYLTHLVRPVRVSVERFLHHADLVVVEEKRVADRLRQDGYEHVMRLPNFRSRSGVTGVAVDRLREHNSLRCVFLSRVTRYKGIFDAIEGIAVARMQRPDVRFSLDIYGPLDGLDAKQLTGSGISLIGPISPDRVVDCLANYDVMLFPTFYPSEGFPGVLIDAALAGLPVIASDWHSNAEIIEDGVNGLIVPAHDPAAIAKKLIYLAGNPETLMHLREGALKSADRYDSAVVVPQLLEALEQKGWILHSETSM